MRGDRVCEGEGMGVAGYGGREIRPLTLLRQEREAHFTCQSRQTRSPADCEMMTERSREGVSA